MKTFIIALFLIVLPGCAQRAPSDQPNTLEKLSGPPTGNLRNPFGVPDIEDPDGEDVQELATRVSLPGDEQDPNAEQWSEETTTVRRGVIDGEWSERWKGTGSNWSYGNGPTRIKTVGDRVYMLIDSSNGKFLIDLKRENDFLLGRYRMLDDPIDTGPCAFRIVNDERIDGSWSGAGRWDLRRKHR